VFDALKVMAWGVGLTTHTVTRTRVVSPAAGGLGPEIHVAYCPAYGFTGAVPASVGRYRRRVSASGWAVGAGSAAL